MSENQSMEARSLWLVRHGQASFGKSDYDNLSERGHEQAYLLGQDFARRGITPDLVVSGSMKRHRQTVAEIALGARWSIAEQPDDHDEKQEKGKDETRRAKKNKSDSDVLDTHRPHHVRHRIDERWNELDHQAMLTAYRPAYKNMLVLKADMVRTLRPHDAFEDMFEKAVDRWTSGEHEDYPETFAAFTERIEGALHNLAAETTGNVLIVTSSGPVCWTTASLAAAGSLDAWKHFTLAAVNTGLTRLTIDRHGTRVISFNDFAHLDAGGLVTNR